MILYLDTSAAVKLIVLELETDALRAFLAHEKPVIVASQLIETELRRAIRRAGVGSQALVTDFLLDIELIGFTPAIARQAGLVGDDGLRSLDAIHLASALAIGADAIATYDSRLAEAALNNGITVEAPTPKSG
jgi:predicted nucleic acid-binding protein